MLRSTALVLGVTACAVTMHPSILLLGLVACAADVYALGVALFELLTGKLPFREVSPLATATARLRKSPRRVASLRRSGRP